MKKLYLTFIFCIYFLVSFGQQRKIDSIKQLIETVQSNEKKAELIIILVNDYLKPEYDEYKKWIDLLCNLETDINNSSYECKKGRLKVLYGNREYISAVNNTKELINENIVANNIQRNYELNRFIADCFYNLREDDSIIKYTLSSKRYITTNNQFAHFYYRMAEMYYIKQDYDSSMVFLDSLFNLSEKLNNNMYKADALRQLAKIQLKTKFYDKALTNLTSSLQITLAIDSISKTVGSTYLDIGRLYFRKRNYKEAIKNYNKSFKIYRKQKRKYILAILHDELSSCYIRTKDFDKALYNVNEAIMIKNELSASADLARSYSRLGRIYYLRKNKDYVKAIEFITKAKKIDSSKGRIEQLMHLEKYLFSIYLKQKKINEAIEHFNLFLKLSDSINKSINRRMLANAEVKYKSLEKEKENLQLKADKIEQELLTQKANTRNWLLVLGIIASLISAFFIWRRYKSETRAKEIINIQKENIERQKDQIEKLQKEFHHRLKNDFRSINSFIGLVQRQFSNTEFKERLNELKNRVTSMFKVHEILLQEDDITQIKAQPYLLELSQNVEAKYEDCNIILKCNVDNTETIVADKAIPFGIILNEFVTNSYKYAFDEKGGEITIDFTSDENNHNLILKDNGKGLPKDFDINSLHSLGISIIPMFADLHDGSYQLDGTNGVSLILTLPKKAT